ARTSLAALGRRICGRERRSRRDQVRHAMSQGKDVLAIRQRQRHGTWQAWHAKHIEARGGPGLRMCQCYMQFARWVAERSKSAVTAPTDRERWLHWQSILGNTPEPPAGPPIPPPTEAELADLQAAHDAMAARFEEQERLYQASRLTSDQQLVSAVR